jgi:hypothetical protein
MIAKGIKTQIHYLLVYWFPYYEQFRKVSLILLKPIISIRGLIYPSKSFLTEPKIEPLIFCSEQNMFLSAKNLTNVNLNNKKPTENILILSGETDRFYVLERLIGVLELKKYQNIDVICGQYLLC